MQRIRRMAVVIVGIIWGGGAGAAQGAAVASQYVEFETTATPNQSLIDSIVSYGLANSSAGGVVLPGSFPAGQTTTHANVVPLTGGVVSLAPTWTSFSLYTLTQAGLAPTYGIAVALNQSVLNQTGGGTFDELFEKNVDTAYNDGQTHTEADLINQFLTNGVADAAFTQGISETPIAEIPYGQTAPIYFFSAGVEGGTMEVTAINVPEPVSGAVGLMASTLVLGGARRRSAR